jgi:hypothetical protein
VLPVALVVSQFATQKILQPPAQDESAQQSNAILKFLPLMIGEAAVLQSLVACLCPQMQATGERQAFSLISMYNLRQTSIVPGRVQRPVYLC